MTTLDKFEAELAEVDARQWRHLLRVRGEVPRLDPKPPELNQLNVLHPEINASKLIIQRLNHIELTIPNEDQNIVV